MYKKVIFHHCLFVHVLKIMLELVQLESHINIYLEFMPSGEHFKYFYMATLLYVFASGQKFPKW